MSVKSSLRLCLLGCGHMGKLHARHLAEDPRVSQLTLCDANVEAAEALMAELASPILATDTGSIDVALKSTDFDAYIIASPAHLHLEQLEIAAKTGAYVFCEKPLGTSYDAISEALPRLMLFADHIQVGFNRRFDPQMAALKAQLEAGVVGPIEQLHIVSRDHTPPTLEQLPNSAGLIAETAIHDFDMVRWLLGDDIKELACHGSAQVNPAYAEHGHIDTATTVLIGSHGQQVVIQNSWRATNGYDQRIEAFGPKGRLNLGNTLADTVVFEDRHGARQSNICDDWSTRYAEAYAIEMRAFVETFVSGASCHPNLIDGAEASKLAHHAQISLKQGVVVPVTSDLP